MKEELKSKIYFVCILLIISTFFIKNELINNIISFVIILFLIFSSKKLLKCDYDLPKNKKIYSLGKHVKLLLISLVSVVCILSILNEFDLDENIEYLLYCLILSIALFFIYYKEMFNSLKLFIKNFKTYLKYILHSQFIIAIIYILAVCIESFLLNGKTDVSANQESLITMPYIILFITSVFTAPFIEEIFFRYIIKQFVKNKYLYILVVALIFGAIHVATETSIIDALIYSIPYATFGGLLAYFYQKSDNIFCTMFNHGIHNLIMCIFLFIG